MNNTPDLIDVLAELMKDSVSELVKLMKYAIRENDKLVADNNSIAEDNKRLQSLVTSQRSEIDALKQELGL